VKTVPGVLKYIKKIITNQNLGKNKIRNLMNYKKREEK